MRTMRASGKALRERFLDTLGAASHGLQVDIAARGAGARDGALRAAMVAAQAPVGGVQDHAGAAALAAGGPSARLAGEHRRIAAAVDEHQALLLALKPRRDRRRQRRREAVLGGLAAQVEEAHAR
jgi:hypothetical protein